MLALASYYTDMSCIDPLVLNNYISQHAKLFFEATSGLLTYLLQ